MTRIGINPIVWSNDDLKELGGQTPVEVCLAEAAAAGYTGIELGHKFPRDPVRLRSMLDDHGLALISGWYGTRLLERSVEAELAALEAHRNLLVALGADVMIVAEVGGAVHGDRRASVSSRPAMHPAALTKLAEDLSKVGAHLAERGLTLVYHHHAGTVIETEDEIDRLLSSSSPHVKLLLDTGHLTFAGGDLARVVKRWGDRVAHVHLKDVRPDALARCRAASSSFLDAVVDGVFTVPGDGAIDFTPVFEGLARDYRGWWVVEADQDPERAPPAKFAKIGHTFVSERLAELK
ncbi:MAG: myo-inosose-2 dehydratase [Deltaproteobacteria bacterium]